MLISSHAFFTIVLLLNSVKKSNSVCTYNNRYVNCQSMQHISSAVIGNIPNITEVNFIAIRSSPNLKIFSKAFQPAVKLKTLLIQNNKNITFYSDSFQNVSLGLISLAGNGISFIPPGTFSNLPLYDVQLENNKLLEVPVDFANSSLTMINLSFNKIRFIDSRSLENLPNLRIIHLRGNRLQSIFPHRILTFPHVLVNLNLVNNSLTRVTNYMLQGLTSLQVLDLGYNSISFIEQYSFEHTPKLTTLILSSNDLKYMDENIFPISGMPDLYALYLDNNRLMYLTSDVFARLINLKVTSIVGNPWWCACLTALERVLEETNIDVQAICDEFHVDGKRPICVDYMANGSSCRYVYNKNLSEKYVTQQSKSLVNPLIPCDTPETIYNFGAN